MVQHYRNIDDALKGLTKWTPNGLPAYPFIVTYEDWYLLAFHVVERLTAAVRRRLAEVGIEPDLVESMHFFLGGADLNAAVPQVAIHSVTPSRSGSL